MNEANVGFYDYKCDTWFLLPSKQLLDIGEVFDKRRCLAQQPARYIRQCSDKCLLNEISFLRAFRGLFPCAWQQRHSLYHVCIAVALVVKSGLFVSVHVDLVSWQKESALNVGESLSAVKWRGRSVGFWGEDGCWSLPRCSDGVSCPFGVAILYVLLLCLWFAVVGFGFVSFENDDAVERACRDHYVSINGKQVLE